MKKAPLRPQLVLLLYNIVDEKVSSDYFVPRNVYGSFW